MSENSIDTFTLEKELYFLIEKAYKFNFLLNLTKAMNTLTSLKDLLDIIVSSATKVSDSDRGSIFLLDKEKNELWSIIAMGIGDMKEIRMPANMGIAGHVATTGQILNIMDAYQDPRFNQEVDKQANYITKSILCIPVKNRSNEIIGTLQVINKKDGHFNKGDEELMDSFCQQAAIAIENARLYEEQKKLHSDLQKTFSSLIEALAASIDAKHRLTAGHSQRVMEYSVEIANEMHLTKDEIDNIRIAALLHDVGKIGIPDDVLSKPGKLTDEEYSIMKTHPDQTKSILDKIYFSEKQKDIPLIASSHHEKINGFGYPYNLKGDKIPLGGKIIAVADVYDALTSERDYRKPMTRKEAISIIKEGSGSHFEPSIVKVFLDLREKDKDMENQYNNI